jgi:lysophospholipase L1-like esterase
MANHYTFGIGQPHTQTDDDLPPVLYDATTQSLVSADGIRFNTRTQHTNIGTRILGGRVVDSAGVLGNTFHVMARLAAEFDAVRLVLMNPTSANVVSVTGAVVAGGSTSDPLQSAATWTAVTWSGASSVTIPLSADSNNPTILLSDWIACKGDTSKLVSARVYIPSAGNTTCPVYSVGNTGAPWAEMENREWIARYQSGDFVTTPASMNSATVRNNSAIVGIQYLARGRVYTVMGIGDSVVSGSNNATTPADAYWVKACRELLSEGYAVEIANCGWSGQTTAQILTRATTLLASIKAPIVLAGLFSPNDGEPSEASDLAMRGRAALLRNLVADSGGRLIGITGIPRAATVSSSNWTSAADDRRKQFNIDMVRTLPVYADIDAVLANSQTLGAASWFADATYTTDFIHPSNAGDIVAAVPAKVAIKSVLS